MRSNTRRVTAALTATVAFAATGGVLAPTAVAGDAGHRERGQLQWENVAASVTIRLAGPPNCDPLEPTRCVFAFDNDSSWVGDVTGHQAQSGGALATDDGRDESAAVSWVTGTVKGCPGAGSFAVAWRATGQPDHTTSGRAVVIDDSGTGGLRGIHGSFTFQVTPNAQGQRATTYVGRLRCDG